MVKKIGKEDYFMPLIGYIFVCISWYKEHLIDYFWVIFCFSSSGSFPAWLLPWLAVFCVVFVYTNLALEFMLIELHFSRPFLQFVKNILHFNVSQCLQSCTSHCHLTNHDLCYSAWVTRKTLHVQGPSTTAQ